MTNIGTPEPPLGAAVVGPAAHDAGESDVGGARAARTTRGRRSAGVPSAGRDEALPSPGMPGAVVHDIDHRVVAVAVVAGVGGNLVALVEGARVDTAPAVDDLAVERAAPPSFRQGIARGAGALVAFHGGAGEVVAFLGGQRRHHARSALAGALGRGCGCGTLLGGATSLLLALLGRKGLAPGRAIGIALGALAV